MKKIFTLFFLLSLGSSFSFGIFPELRPWTEPDEVLNFFKANHQKPVGAEENAQIVAFMRSIEGVMPKDILLDLKTRGLGYRLGIKRVYSDEDKDFIKANLQHLHLLKFLVNANLENLDLDGLPANFAELKALNILDLQNNKLTHVPQAIYQLQETNKIFLDLSNNPIDADEKDPVLKKSCDLLWEGNIHSLISAEDTEWNDIFKLKNRKLDLEIDPENYAFAPLVELIALCSVDGRKEEYDAWISSDENAARFIRFTDEFEPDQAMEFLANFPEISFKESLCGQTPSELRLLLMQNVLDHLRECGLVNVTGEIQKRLDDTEMMVPQVVQGWQRFFTGEPIGKAEGVWFTPEGVHVLFNIVKLIERPYNPGMSASDIKAFEKLDEETNIPFLISEDIRLLNSVGIRRRGPAMLARGKSDVERQWIAKNKDRLTELPNLRFINLAKLELSDVPDNYHSFRDLRVVFLYNNKVTAITEKMRMLLKHYTPLTIDLQYNPVLEGYETLTTRKLIAYQDFIKKHGEPPASLTKDIVQHLTIGVHQGASVGLSDAEKKWVHDRIDHLHELYFLKGLNLSGMDLTSLPKSIGDLRYLEAIWLEHNKLARTPPMLAKIAARNPNLRIFVGDNPFYKSPDKKFERLVEEEHKKYVAEQKKLSEDAEQARIDMLISNHVKPDINPSELEWHPDFIKRLGFGDLKKGNLEAYTPRQSLLDHLQRCDEFIASTKDALKIKSLTKAEKKKYAKELNEIIALRKATEKQLDLDRAQFDNNKWKYVHIFFEWFLRQAEEMKIELKENDIQLPVFSQAADDDRELSLNKAENEVWLNDPIHLRMLYIFLCTHSPEDFMNLLQNQKQFLSKMLEIKKMREQARVGLPELYNNFRDESKGLSLKTLQDRSEAFYPVLLSSIGPQGKYIPILKQSKSGRGVEMQHYGWEPYLTKRPDVEKKYTGWYKKQGIAELLIFLDLVSRDEQDKGKGRADDD